MTNAKETVGTKLAQAWLFPLGPTLAIALVVDKVRGKTEEQNYWRNLGVTAAAATVALGMYYASKE